MGQILKGAGVLVRAAMGFISIFKTRVGVKLIQGI